VFQVPVGLLGLGRKSSRVRGVMAAASASTSRPWSFIGTSRAWWLRAATHWRKRANAALPVRPSSSGPRNERASRSIRSVEPLPIATWLPLTPSRAASASRNFVPGPSG
jgi:hypothetical protein